MITVALPYACFVLFFLFFFAGRSSLSSRNSAFLYSLFVLAAAFIAFIGRPLRGDSLRYYSTFLEVSDVESLEALASLTVDPLFIVLLWFGSRLGDTHLHLFASTLIIYLGLFIWIIRKNFQVMDAAAIIVIYSMYPIFVLYGINGLRQGISLVFLICGYFFLYKRHKSGWIWILIAPFWHAGAWLAVAVVAGIFFLFLCFSSVRSRWFIILVIWGSTVLSSMSGLNETLGLMLSNVVSLESRHQYYFSSIDESFYQTGFRLDFFLFSIVPILTAGALVFLKKVPCCHKRDWWLFLYLALNSIYHFFSFVPYADRFSAYSWFILPIVLFYQFSSLGHRSVYLYVATFSLFNVLLVFTYLEPHLFV